MSIKSLFKRAVANTRYQLDCFTLIPSTPVSNKLIEEGWRFENSGDIGVTITPPPALAGEIRPFEVVTVECGSLYVGGDRKSANQYEAAKRRAAALVHGI